MLKAFVFGQISLLAALIGSAPAFALTSQEVVKVNVNLLGQFNFVYKLDLLSGPSGDLEKLHFYEINNVGNPEYDKTIPVNDLKVAEPPAMVQFKGTDTIWVILDPSFDKFKGGAATVRFRKSLLNHQMKEFPVVLHHDSSWVAYSKENNTSFSEMDVQVTLMDATLKPKYDKKN